MTHTNLTSRVTPWIKKSLTKHAPGDDVVWDAAINAYPDDLNPEGGLVVLLTVYIQIGTLSGMFVTLPSQTTSEVIDSSVASLVGKLKGLDTSPLED